jgi:hypothetical protein
MNVTRTAGPTKSLYWPAASAGILPVVAATGGFDPAEQASIRERSAHRRRDRGRDQRVGEQYRRALRMTPNEIASYSMPACANHHPTFAKYAHLAAGQRHKALGGEKRRILVSNNQTELLPAVQRTHFDVYQPARGC